MRCFKLQVPVFTLDFSVVTRPQPREPLYIGTGGQTDLLRRLEQHDGDLSEFCIALWDGLWPVSKVSDLLKLMASESSSTTEDIPCLVLQICSGRVFGDHQVRIPCCGCRQRIANSLPLCSCRFTTVTE